MTLRYAFVADDFTGATDTLATLAGAGLRVALYLDATRMATDTDSDAVGLATSVRSLATPHIGAALAPAAQALRTLRPPIVHYKVCSTFDSAPGTGSIGAAVAALRDAVPNDFLPIVGGQPSLRRYCVFGNLFAGAGPDGPVHRIDRHPTMRDHPVTPMHEADLRVHLAAQGLTGMASIDCTAYTGTLAVDVGTTLFDVVAASHLARIGELLSYHARRQPLLAVGASSVAQAMIAAWRREGTLAPAETPPRPAPARGPVFVLSGSRSPVTARQLAHAPSYAMVALTSDPARDAARCIELLASGRHVLAHLEATARGQPDAFAAAGARLLATVLATVPLTRIGVSGGDTSSHAIHALGVDRLEYTAALQPGVALCRIRGRRFDGLDIMLKGGQMGSTDIFERLLAP